MEFGRSFLVKFVDYAVLRRELTKKNVITMHCYKKNFCIRVDFIESGDKTKQTNWFLCEEAWYCKILVNSKSTPTVLRLLSKLQGCGLPYLRVAIETLHRERDLLYREMR